MRNRQEWFNEKMAAVSPEIVSEVQLSADIIARIDGAAISGSCWSATEYDGVNVWAFNPVWWGYSEKTDSYSVRPVLGF